MHLLDFPSSRLVTLREKLLFPDERRHGEVADGVDGDHAGHGGQGFDEISVLVRV